MAYAFVAITTFLVLLSCGSCVHESKAGLDDARNQLTELLLQEINDNAQTENTGKNEVRDGGKNAFTETTGRNRLLEQFTKLIQGFVDSESEEPGSLADKETEADAESSEPVCITYIKVTAKTGTLYGAAQSSQYGADPKLVIGIYNLAHEASLEGKKFSGYTYTKQVSLSSFQPSDSVPSCLTKNMITSVQLKAEGNDGWYIRNIKTEVSASKYSLTILTQNDNLNKWVDSNEADKYSYNAKLVPLTLQRPKAIKDTPHCGYGVPVCECKAAATQCILNLEIDEIMTFTSYQKFGVGLKEGLAIRGTQGVVYTIDERSGNAAPHPFYSERLCAKENKDNCTEPQYVDGKTYRMAVGVNGQIPGPTIIVHHGQEVVIHVHNNMSTEGISIHWHGLHQRGTPWMDGVGQVTQCQIGPSSSYSYSYIANPAGSFWYHSHSGAQRTDGFFGALIVKERPDQLKLKMAQLNIHGVKQFLDIPAEHSITLLDWNHDASLATFSQLNAGLGFFEGVPLGEGPSCNDVRYESTRSIERAEVGPVPFYSGLINGKGRHKDLPYSKTRLSEFHVRKGNKYRFRLIGSQGLYAYKFSIDGHRLTVVATDGYWIEPVKNVDYIIIHTGERYDFILEATQTAQNYWLRAETLEINPKGGPPYQSLGHVAEGILRYVSSENVPPISSTEYEEIKLNSPSIKCSSSHQCNAVNCPFKDFHPAYHIKCTNVDKLRLLQKTDQNEMPSANPSPGCSDCLHFINFNFEGDSETSSVNGRNFILPPAPPQTQYEDYLQQGNQCDLKAECNPTSRACTCTHMKEVPYGKTIQLVLTAMGAYDNAHPIHLHGHTFHVVKVGYPDYNSNTGFIDKEDGPLCDNKRAKLSVHNRDIQCGDLKSCGSECPTNGCKPNRCTKPGWKNGSPFMSIDRKTIRKDTVILPAGGYVVINYISDNPGQWFLHCHIEVHQLEGMALILNEAHDKQKLLQLPENLNKCGDSSLSFLEAK